MATEKGRVYEKSGTLASGASLGATLLVRTRLILLWADVAVEQEILARKGRAEIVRVHTAGETPYPLKLELQPAMIAIAACAHSLDGLYAELAEYVVPETLTEWEAARRGGRWAEIAAMLDLSVDADVTAWRRRLEDLFTKLRNPAVHPKAKSRPPARHPALPTNVALEYAIYTVEAVEESVDLLFEILSTCVEAPRTSIEAWAAESRPIVAQLKNRRGQETE